MPQVFEVSGTGKWEKEPLGGSSRLVEKSFQVYHPIDHRWNCAFELGGNKYEGSSKRSTNNEKLVLTQMGALLRGDGRHNEGLREGSIGVLSVQASVPEFESPAAM